MNRLPIRLEQPLQWNALPLTLLRTTPRHHAWAFLILALAFDAAGLAIAVQAVWDGRPVEQLWPALLAPCFGLAALLGALEMIAHKEVLRIGECGVTFECHGLLGVRRWCEPLSAFEGIECQDGLAQLKRDEARALVSTIRLRHRDRARSILLYATLDGRKARFCWERVCRLLGLPAMG